MMGGASEHDNAMRWFLEQANGGDILVLRASGSNGYNDYLFSQLGVNVNSVETIVCTDESSGEDSYIIDKINKAEGIWFAGGNQWDYINYWRNSNVNLALSQAINRKCVFGGTSAGMAILGDHYFTAENGTITSDVALNNPFHQNATVSSEAFLSIPFLESVITDTHYDNPDRKGRHVAFIAKQTTSFQTTTYGIACEEYVAVCIDTLGIAHVYGEYPSYDEQAYFISPNCEFGFNFPEICQLNSPLTWNQSNRALKVFKANGTMEGSSTFNLNTWKNGTGGVWQNWWVDQGTLNIIDDFGPNCTNDIKIPEDLGVNIQNPVGINEWFFVPTFLGEIKIYDTFGGKIDFVRKHNSILIRNTKPGLFYIEAKNKVYKIILTN
jgi:cyanophycinase-like exopeptidase